MMERALPGCRFGLLVAILGSSLLAGRSAAAAPTIPLPEPGGELGLLPLLAILGIFAAVIVAERVRPRRPRSGAASQRWFGNLSLGIVSNGVLVLPTITAFTAAWCSELEHTSLVDSLELPSGMRIFAAIVGLDALAYAQHRLLHRVDVLWRLHAVHHSDPEIDVTTTFRHHPLEAIFNSVLIGGVVLATEIGADAEAGGAQAAVEGAEVIGNTPAQFDAYVRSEISKWSNVVKVSGARAD